MNIVLLPLSWLYGMVAAARNAAFDAGLLRQTQAGVPVLSVGNLTAGGTGKTPLTGHIVGLLLRRGRKPAVVSRGYGRESRGVVIVACAGQPTVSAALGGDEPVQIARNFPGIPVVVGERRAEAAAVAVDRCGADVIVMDDGFQHRYLRRDADILVLDARKDIRRIPLLPAGLRREWISGMRRASLLMFSRCGEEGLPSWSRDIAPRFEGRMAGCRFRIAGFRSIADGTETRSEGPAVAFSGIGDHDEFLRTLRDAGITLAGDRRFPDHHRYTRKDLAGVVELAKSTGAGAIITTEKDMVRLEFDSAVAGELLQGIPAMTATLTVEITEGNDVFESVIDTCLRGSGR
jgi:tetraacyldisaccharide 4'-kinase